LKFEIYHQLGANYKWNIESFQDDGVGDGIILAPKYMTRQIVEKLDTELKNKAIFDPQFFNPHQINERMKTYDFYPECLMPSGYDTNGFSDYSSICAEKCMDFQSINDFKFFVIPTKYFEGTPNVENVTDFHTKQFINPSLETINNLSKKKKVILQLVLNNQMIKDVDYSNYLLNWLTGIDGIDGVYIIVEFSSWLKQIDDPDYLFSFLKFCDVLSQNNLITILGYLNTEAILLSLANPNALTIGSHGNLRVFNHLHFENYEEEPGVKRKTPWVFIPSMLDWIDFRIIQAHLKGSSDFKKYLGGNKYSDEMLKPSYNPDAIKNRYYHFFVEGANQLKEINKFEGKERYSLVCDAIKSAIDNRSRLTKDLGVPLLGEGYLNQWLIAANLFASYKGWR